jgi:hypothetical protein
MSSDYLMNIASGLFFICYIPEFYANYKNKNANGLNVVEKIVMLAGTGCALGYSMTIHSSTLQINYSIIFGLDVIALLMRMYYAYKNRNIDVRIKQIEYMYDPSPEQIVVETHNPINDIEYAADI